jgi:hypothetical protein
MPFPKVNVLNESRAVRFGGRPGLGHMAWVTAAALVEGGVPGSNLPPPPLQHSPFLREALLPGPGLGVQDCGGDTTG